MESVLHARTWGEGTDSGHSQLSTPAESISVTLSSHCWPVVAAQMSLHLTQDSKNSEQVCISVFVLHFQAEHTCQNVTNVDFKC